jgi:type II secretory pathway pseudopilin PulG
MSRSNTQHMTAAFTIMELLIVMAILIAVTAAAIPVLAPAVQGRKSREASRLVTSFIAQARTKAIELGRPVGVMFERMESNRLACNRLSMVEVPPLFSGETTQATCSAVFSGVTTTNFTPPAPPLNPTMLGVGQPLDSTKYEFISVLSVQPAPTTVNAGAPAINATAQAGFLSGSHVGDRIRLGPNQDWEFELIGPDGGVWEGASGPLPDNVLDDVDSTTRPIFVYYARRPLSGGSGTPTWLSTTGMPTTPAEYGKIPFEVLRQPQRTSVGTLQLPEGTCIDLYWSGGETNGVAMLSGTTWSSADFLDNPILLFSPTGAVDSVYLAGTRYPVSANLYLLVGRPDGMAFTYQGGSSISQLNDRGDKKHVENLVDLNNQWVTVAPATGRVVALENTAYKDSAGIAQNDPNTANIQIIPGNAAGSTAPFNKMRNEVVAARQIAITGQQVSGN